MANEDDKTIIEWVMRRRQVTHIYSQKITKAYFFSGSLENADIWAERLVRYIGSSCIPRISLR